jgi:16S rRNA (guanine1207-N2)-methyltransferase
MSGPARPLAEADDPSLDPGVLFDAPLVEWHGWQGVRRHGGTAVLPWRPDHLAASRAGVATVGNAAVLPEGSWSQVLVRIQKGRAATWQDLVQAWDLLADGGRMLITGANELGISTWVKRLASALAQPGEVLANHSRARVAVFHRSGAARLVSPEVDADHVPLWPTTWDGALVPSCIRRSADGATPTLRVPPGVFSHGELDAGTALLLEHLAQRVPATRVLDLGCGAGHLGIHALLRWPSASACFVDADARAVAAVSGNLADPDLGLAARAQVAWWDVSEPLPATGFDLILCNPPCHAGTTTDFAAAQAMFRHAAASLTPSGQLVVVANRQLPYENDLARLGVVSVVEQRGAFKLLQLVRTTG